MRNVFPNSVLDARSIPLPRDLGKFVHIERPTFEHAATSAARPRICHYTKNQHVLAHKTKQRFSARWPHGRSPACNRNWSRSTALLCHDYDRSISESDSASCSRDMISTNLANHGPRTFESAGARREMKLLNMFPYAPHLAFWHTLRWRALRRLVTSKPAAQKCLAPRANCASSAKFSLTWIIGMPTFVYHVLHQAAEGECAL